MDANSLKTQSHKTLGSLIDFLSATYNGCWTENVWDLNTHLTALSESLLESFIVTG